MKKFHRLFRIEYIYFFFIFLSNSSIFNKNIVCVLKNYEVYSHDLNSTKFKNLRRDIVDRNGILISRNVKTYHAAVNPRLIKDKKKFSFKNKNKFSRNSDTRFRKKVS